MVVSIWQAISFSDWWRPQLSLKSNQSPQAFTLAEALIDGVHAEALYNLSGCLSGKKRRPKKKAWPETQAFLRKAHKLHCFKLLNIFQCGKTKRKGSIFHKSVSLICWGVGTLGGGGVQPVMEVRRVIIPGTFNCASRAARHYLRLIPVRHPDSPAAQEAGFAP